MLTQTLKIAVVSAAFALTTAFIPAIALAQSTTNGANGTNGSTGTTLQQGSGQPPSSQTNSSSTTTNTTPFFSLGNLISYWWVLPLALIVILLAVLANSGRRDQTVYHNRDVYRTDHGFSGAKGGSVERRNETVEDTDNETIL